MTGFLANKWVPRIVIVLCVLAAVMMVMRKKWDPAAKHDAVLDDRITVNLDSPIEAARVMAVRRLAGSGLPEWRGLLFRAMINDSPAVQREAAAALAETADPALAASLVAGLGVADDAVQMICAKALLLLPDAGTEEMLDGLENSRPAAVRAWCAAILGQRQEEAAVPRLGTLIHADEDRVAAAAVAALARFDKRGPALLAAQFETLLPRVRAQAAMALVEHGWSDEVERLAARGDAQTVIACLEGMAGAGVAGTFIEQYLDDPDPSIRRAAVTAAAVLECDSLDDRLPGLAADPDPIIRLLASRRLKEYNSLIFTGTVTPVSAGVRQ
ncbi:HEAT repeat domain-containing protein [bacterium]|nr:HEAT repeat domain-containing protein [candidate division CSSED10-310 bacterium]